MLFLALKTNIYPYRKALHIYTVLQTELFSYNVKYKNVLSSVPNILQASTSASNDSSSVISTCPQCNATLCPLFCQLLSLESNQWGMGKLQIIFNLSCFNSTNIKRAKEVNTQSHSISLSIIPGTFTFWNAPSQWQHDVLFLLLKSVPEREGE